VDCCGSISALTRIMLHAVRPAVVTVGLFAFLAAWNEYFAPLILLSSDDRSTLPLAVATMRVASHGAIDYLALEAGVMFMALPCLVLFLFLQRSYVRGFMTGTLRG
jgi:multiple sugar transport system permease protein